MFVRKKVSGGNTGSGQIAGFWLLLSLFMLLPGTALLSGCGGTATATTPTPPPTPAQSIPLARPLHTIVQTFDKDFTITLDITPNRSGPNHFNARIIDNRAHKPAAHVTVTLYTTMQDMAMGTDSVALHGEGSGQFGATSDVLIMAGDWALGITIQTADHVTHKAGVSFVLFSS